MRDKTVTKTVTFNVLRTGALTAWHCLKILLLIFWNIPPQQFKV